MIVYKNRVWSKNFISDFGMKLKNIVGGRLKSYEKMMDKATQEAIDELVTECPGVRNMRLQITEFKDASICITVYGEVDEPWQTSTKPSSQVSTPSSMNQTPRFG